MKADAVVKAQKQAGDQLTGELAETLNQLEKALGGRVHLASTLMATGNADAKRIAAALVKQKNRKKDLYTICREAQSSPEALSRAIEEGSLMKATMETFMQLASGVPEVVKKSIDVAVTGGVEGYKDRELILKVSGLLKEGRGVQVNLNQNISQIGSGGFEKMIRDIGVNASEDPFIDVETD